MSVYLSFFEGPYVNEDQRGNPRASLCEASLNVVISRALDRTRVEGRETN